MQLVLANRFAIDFERDNCKKRHKWTRWKVDPRLRAADPFQGCTRDLLMNLETFVVHYNSCARIYGSGPLCSRVYCGDTGPFGAAKIIPTDERKCRFSQCQPPNRTRNRTVGNGGFKCALYCAAVFIDVSCLCERARNPNGLFRRATFGAAVLFGNGKYSCSSAVEKLAAQIVWKQ